MTTQVTARIWNGWTAKANANELERVLVNKIIPAFERGLPQGFHGMQVLRCDDANEVKFTTIMFFSSIDSIKVFAGEDYKASHIDPRIAPLLTRFDKHAVHCQMKYSSYLAPNFPNLRE